MPRPTLAPNGVIGLLVPWGNTTTQLEVEPLTPPGVCNAVGRFDFGPGVDLEAELRAVADKLTYTEPSAMLVSLSPELRAGGLALARSLRALVEEASGLPTCTTTEGTIWELGRQNITTIGLITPTPAEGADTTAAAFEAEGFTVAARLGMNCGLSNIKATSLEDIAAALHAVDTPAVEALVQVGTGLPAFAVATQVQTETGKPVITSGAAGYRQILHSLRGAP